MNKASLEKANDMERNIDNLKGAIEHFKRFSYASIGNQGFGAYLDSEGNLLPRAWGGIADKELKDILLPIMEKHLLKLEEEFKNL